MFDTSQLTGLLMQSMDPMQQLARNMLTSAAQTQSIQTDQMKADAILDIRAKLNKLKEEDGDATKDVAITALEKILNRLGS